MKIENENTFLAAINSGFNFFVGSGFSTLAADKQGRPLPIGSQLCNELIDIFGVPDGLNLAQIATILNSSHKAEFQSYLKERFTVGEFDTRYQVVERLPIRSIFTTNIDNLLHQIYKNGATSYLNDLDIRGSTFSDRNAIDLITLHGCVLNDSRDLTFDATDLASAFAREPDRWHCLVQALESAPTLFCGYSLADAGTLNSLHPSSSSGREISDKWIAVLPGTDEGTLQFFRALKFQIIECNISQLLEYFQAHCRPVVAHRPESSTRELFPEWAIPDIGSVPVRPIFGYFRGAPPTWYDVYSGQLSTTSHHARVRDVLNSGQHTLITGIPGSGKTTLVMQVLKDFPFTGHKLFCEAPTQEKANLILNRLDGSRALIGIDNFADDLDGVNTLINAPNVQVLGCDEIYWLEIVSHRLPRGKIQVIDVTDLSEEDTQAIVSRIPSDIRGAPSRVRQPRTEQTPSIFEIVESNIHLPTLSERYRQVLKNIGQQDIRLLEFLLVCAYVHSCRTPISVDMLFAFFRGTDISLGQLDAMRDRLLGIVVDYVGDLDDGAQNYYSPRSTLVSQAIIRQASPRQLKSVIVRFHNQVSSYRIHRYDVFRRRAFAHELMRGVFEDWEEGMTFYRDCYSKERSAYILQQGALYLSSKHRYQEAFQMIDESLSVSNRRIPSIRNSHAVILFEANIGRQETDGIVKQTLQESMEILKECYHYDQRKAYHAQVFADHSLRYDYRFGRSQAQGYLETALSWLREERRNSPWNREVDRLYGVVARRLGVSHSVR